MRSDLFYRMTFTLDTIDSFFMPPAGGEAEFNVRLTWAGDEIYHEPISLDRHHALN
jgi:hypothetical protein